MMHAYVKEYQGKKFLALDGYVGNREAFDVELDTDSAVEALTELGYTITKTG